MLSPLWPPWRKKERQDKPADAPVPMSEPSADREGTEILEHGVPNVHDILSPPCIDRSHPDKLRCGDHWVKTVVVSGLPSEVRVGWLDGFLGHDGNLDLAVHIDPIPDRSAIHAFSSIITRLKAKLRFNLTKQGTADDLQRAIDDTTAIRDMVASNRSRAFKMTVAAGIWERDDQALTDAFNLIDGTNAGRHVYLKSLDLRQDEGFQAVAPLGMNFLQDIYRTVDTYGLGTVLPFTDSDLVHPGGYQLGVNLRTGSPIIYNPYDRSLNNHNITVFADSGSGKSATIKTITGRGLFTGERCAIIDPEGEYANMAEYLGGVSLPIGPGADYCLNPCDIDAEEDPDSHAVSVNLTDKVLTLLDLVGAMVQGLTAEEQSLVEKAIREMYGRFGITRDPESIYTQGSVPDPDRPGLWTFGRQRKRMPQLSDLVAILSQSDGARRVVSALGPYYGDGVLAFFDGQSNVQIDNQWLVVFDLSLLDERIGRPVGLHVVLTWLWNDFIKKSPLSQKKRIVVDEAWLLCDSEFGMRFLENVVRRVRKRTGGLTIISQDFRRFANHPRGPAILSNSDTFILMRAKEFDLPLLQSTFSLSDGEIHQISLAPKGGGIVRVKNRPYAFYCQQIPWEKEWAYTTALKDAR